MVVPKKLKKKNEIKFYACSYVSVLYIKMNKASKSLEWSEESGQSAKLSTLKQQVWDYMPYLCLS